jgi:hypothetical protein
MVALRRRMRNATSTAMNAIMPAMGHTARGNPFRNGPPNRCEDVAAGAVRASRAAE